MVNFGLLMAEICWRVWGTPANFNGFRVLAALLHGTLVLGVSQTLRRWTEGATYIRKGGHHVRHWPTFELNFFCSRRQPIEILLNSLTITGRTVLLFRLNRGWHFETRKDAINWSWVWSRVANNNLTMCVYRSLNDFCEFQLFISCQYRYRYL